MKKSLFNFFELSGILFCMVSVCLLRTIYVASPQNTVAILFGSVNLSVWEQLKPVILCYILYGIIELMWAKPYFRQFVVSKALGLYASVVLYIILSLFIPAELGAPVTLAAIAAGFITSKFLTLSSVNLSCMFVPACLMLLLIFIMYFSFTAFPPKLGIFMDSESGMYGIIPDYIDIGANRLKNVI